MSRKTALSRFPPVHKDNLEGRLRVETSGSLLSSGTVAPGGKRGTGSPWKRTGVRGVAVIPNVAGNLLMRRGSLPADFTVLLI